MRPDILELSDTIDEWGVGTLPPQDMPARPQSFTPADTQQQYTAQRTAAYKQLQPLIDINAAITEQFCTDPRSTVSLSVDPQHYHLLFKKQYDVAHSMRTSIDTIIQKWLTMGRIKLAPTNCRFNSPLLPVPKKDDQGRMTGVRLCIDVRNLNKYLQQNDRFLLPHIPDVLATFKGNTLFGEFDLTEAFFQFRLTEESQQYTAFTWNQTQYVCVGTPFGIKHIPSLFQRYMCQLFSDMPFVFPYIDNIAFASRTWEEHIRHATAIMERLNSVNLRVKPSSTNFGNTHLRLLGHVISADGVTVDPEKQKMILDWPEPKTGEVLASALGLGAFLHDHIRHYADITAPLEEIKRVKGDIVWTDKLREHWQLFKRAFATAPLLRFPDFNKRFVLATDASQTGIGGILYQPDDEQNTITSTNIVAITSKKLDATQRNYPVYKKELFAVIHSLRKFHSYIWGRRDVLVLTDHRPLIHILNQKNLSVALQQWLDVLLHYDLHIQYRPGLLHVYPDAISRMYMGAYDNNNVVWGTLSNIHLLNAADDPATMRTPSDHMCIQSINEIRPPATTKRRHKDSTKIAALTHSYGYDDDSSPFTLPSFDDDYQYQWYQCEDSHHVFVRMESLDDITPVLAPASSSSSSSSAPSSTTTTTDNDSATQQAERRNCRLPSEEERQALLQAAHDHGHFGYNAVHSRLQKHERVWWPHMKNDINRIIAHCERCQRYTVVKTGYHASRAISALLPGDHYQIDFASFPTSTEGYTHCLVLVDVFTGFVILRAVKDTSAQSTARTLWDIFSIIGLPRILQSDNGDAFSSQLMHAFTHMLGVPHRFIAAYNPRADGKVERVVRTIKTTIMKLMRGANIFWPFHLAYVQYAYNDKIHTLTGSSPFSLMFGRSPNVPADFTHTATTTPIDISNARITWRQHQQQLVSLIFPAINQRVTAAQQKYIDRLNTTRNIITHSLPPGTRVMLKDPAYILDKSIKPGREPTYMGAYTIIRRLPTGPYIVKDDTDVVIDRPVPLDQMRVLPARPPSTHTNDDDDTDIYEVDRIIDHRIVDGHSLEYKVKWKKYPLEQATWEKENNIIDTHCIHLYFKELQKKSQPQPATSATPALRLTAINNNDDTSIYTREQTYLISY